MLGEGFANVAPEIQIGFPLLPPRLQPFADAIVNVLGKVEVVAKLEHRRFAAGDILADEIAHPVKTAIGFAGKLAPGRNGKDDRIGDTLFLRMVVHPFFIDLQIGGVQQVFLL